MNMERIKLFIKAMKYSAQLVYEASRVECIVYGGIRLLIATFPLISAYLLKMLLDLLTLGQFQVQTLINIGLSYGGIILLSQIVEPFRDILYNNTFEKAKHCYDRRVLRKVETLPMSVIDTSQGKDLIDDVEWRGHTAAYLFFDMINSLTLIYSFGVAFIVLCQFNLVLTILFLVFTIPGIIVQVRFRSKSEELRYSSASGMRKANYYRWMLTDVWPAKDVRMYDLTADIKERYEHEKNKYRRASKVLDRKLMNTAILTEGVRRSGEVIFILFVLWQAIQQEITVGDITLYITYMTMATGAFEGMVQFVSTIFTWVLQGMERVLQFFGAEHTDRKGARQLDIFKSLEFRDVYFKYPHTDNYILKGVSFVLEQGDKLALIGINGAGKSTIIKLMLGLYEIESGEILLNGYPLETYTDKSLNQLYSVLFQNFVQYPLTLRENITLSKLADKDNDTAIYQALEESGVDTEDKEMRNGLDVWMTRQFDDKGIELSKGQWQKIALARVYFKRSPIIIFDEPSSALDAEAEDKIFKNFENLAKNKTGIMISHRISSAKICSKIIVLDEGKIVELGTHEELVQYNGLYAQLYTLQLEKYTLKEVM